MRATIKYLRRTASGAAGSSLGTAIKYLRRTASGAVGNGLSRYWRTDVPLHHLRQQAE
jgi:hypothetical protein